MLALVLASVVAAPRLVYRPASVRSVIKRCGCLLGAFLWLGAAHASADARVFERGRDEATGEVSNPREHRFVDLMAFVQPGVLFRITDPDEELARGDDQILLHRARLGVDAVPIWWARLRLELELADGAPSLQDALVELMPHDAIHVSIGRMPVPFLLAYRFHESRLGLVDRPIYTPLAGQRPFVSHLSVREIGAQVSGRVGDLSEGATMPVFEYALAAMVRGNGADPGVDDGSQWLYAGRVTLHVRGLADGHAVESDLARNVVPRVAVAGGVYSSCGENGEWSRGWTADTELRWQGLHVSGSFVWLKNGPAANGQLGYGRCDGMIGPDGTALRTVTAGAHAQLAYVLPELLFPVRNQAVELVTRFDWVSPRAPFDGGRKILGGDTDHPQYTAPSAFDDALDAPTRWRVTLGATWYPTGHPELRVQLNYQINRELEDVVTMAGTTRDVRNEVVWLQITAGL